MLLAAGTDNGVALLALSGETWTLRAHGLYGQKVADLVVAPSGAIFACASNGMVYRTTDWERWEPRFEGLPGTGVHSLAVTASGALLAGTAPPAVYRSDDEGATWQVQAGFTRVPGRDHWTYPAAPYRPRVCRLRCGANGVVVAGIEEGGLLVSPDEGRRWTERQRGLPPAVNDVAHFGDFILATTKIGLFGTPDLGANWVPIKAGIPYDHTRCVSLDMVNKRRVLVGVRTTQGGYSVVRSQDSGVNWEIANTGLPALKDEPITRLLCGPGVQFVGTAAGQLFWSNDVGSLWRKVGATLPSVGALLVLEG